MEMAMEGNLEMSKEFFMEIWNGYERSKELEEENKKLKEELDYYKRKCDFLNNVVVKYQEED